MPSINLRLTDSQHAELERWATDGHRSLQKEIIFRLFGRQDYIEAATSYAAPPTEIVAAADGSVVTLSEKPKKRLHPCRHHVPPSRHCEYCDV